MTPATIELDRAGCTYRTLEFEPGGARDYGAEAARALEVPETHVYKTLMAQLADGEMVVAIVPVDSLLDLKLLARAAGSKRASMSPPDLAERRTGYPVGGISPFGQRNRHRTFVDERAREHSEIYVSGGRRGLELAVEPAALRAVLDAVLVPLTRT